MTIFVRQLSLEMDSRVIVLYRAMISFVFLVPAVLLYAPWRRQLRITRPWMHFWRGLAVVFSTHLGFYGIAKMELVTFTVIVFTAPIWATVFGVLLNGEKTGPRRLAAIAVGFLGVVIVLRPGVVPMSAAMFASLGSALLFGIALTLSRRVAEADGALSAFVSSTVMMFLISIPIAAPIATIPTGSSSWILILLLVATGTIRSVADLQAYRIGEASVLAPFAYLRIVLIGIAAYVLFNEVPDFAAIIGAVVIIGAALYIAHREAQARRVKT